MTIEKLTDEHRRQLEALYVPMCGAPGMVALRIIDQLTAALEAAEKRAEHNAEGIEFWSMRYTAANDRAEALAAYLAGRPEASDHVAESELATAKARAAELEARVGAFMRVWHGADGGDTDEAINDAIDALSEVCNVKA